MPTPTLSIIIPCLNPPAGFHQTVRNLLQEYGNGVEIIISDSGGLDLSKLPDAENLKHWSEPDSGQADAINKGIKRSQGELIGYLNTDDQYFPDALNTVKAAFSRHPEARILYGRGIHMDAFGNWLEDYPTHVWDYGLLKRNCFLCQPAVFWRREIHERFGYLDEELHFALDYEFWLRLGKEIPFLYLREHYLAKTQLHPFAKTVKYPRNAKWEHLLVKQRHTGRIDAQACFEYCALLAGEETEERRNSRRFAELFLTGMEQVENSFTIEDLSIWQMVKLEMKEMATISKPPLNPPLKKPTILVDFSLFQAGGKHGGIKTALYSLLFEIANTRDFNLLFTITRELRTEISERFGPLVTQVICDENTDVNELVATHHPNLIFCPLPSIRFNHSEIPMVFLSPDLLHLDYPDSLSRNDREYRENLIRVALAHADLILTVSKFSRQRLIEAYDVPHRKIWVLPHALPTGHPPPTLIPDPEAPKHFLYPANFWAHKNHRTLLVAFKRYLRKAKEPWHLILTGHPDAGNSQAIEHLIHALALQDQVRYLGYLTGEDYSAVWANAGALVFPSNYEGFGLPLLEAMAWEIPIIAANIPSLREVADSAAIYVDQHSPDSISDALLNISEDTQLRHIHVEKGRERLKAFSWTEPAKTFTNLANNLMAKKAGLPS